jgi:hypothetical protein
MRFTGNPTDFLSISDDPSKITIVLDLDETLVDGRTKANTFYVRPGVDTFLSFLGNFKKTINVIIWSAGTETYVKKAIEVLGFDKFNVNVVLVIYFSRTWIKFNSNYTKDLSLLGQNMDNVLLIDNTPEMARASPKNTIIVPSFTFESIVSDDGFFFIISDIILQIVSFSGFINVQNFLQINKYIYSICEKHILSEYSDDIIQYYFLDNSCYLKVCKKEINQNCKESILVPIPIAIACT